MKKTFLAIVSVILSVGANAQVVEIQKTVGSTTTTVATFKNSTSTTYKAVMRKKGTGTVNGYAYVDMGLPSGTLWATKNIGASNETAYGNFFKWGETIAYDNSKTYYTQGCAATAALWGPQWSVPTYTQFKELYDNCNISHVTYLDRPALKFTSKINGNVLYLRKGGYYQDGTHHNDSNNADYWTSTANGSNHYIFDTSTFYGYYNNVGFLVRLVVAQ